MQYTTEELQTIIDLHEKWLYNKEEGKRASLTCASLTCASLTCAALTCASLTCAALT